MTNADGLSDRQEELRYLLNRWDPIGVYDESLNFPPDEYDCLIGPLLVRLVRRDSRADLSQYLWDEIENHFGVDPVRCEPIISPIVSWHGSQRNTKTPDSSGHPHVPLVGLGSYAAWWPWLLKTWIVCQLT
jgi:hypothetical protein